jgi:hypothetical protein
MTECATSCPQWQTRVLVPLVGASDAAGKARFGTESSVWGPS